MAFISSLFFSFTAFSSGEHSLPDIIPEGLCGFACGGERPLERGYTAQWAAQALQTGPTEERHRPIVRDRAP
jgi:hypothetical protein